MRRTILGASVIIIAVLFLAGCNSDDSHGASKTASNPVKLSSETPVDGVRRITVTELKSAVDKGSVLIVDVRAPEAYAGEHIKGSISIPEPETLARSSEFPRDKMIVFYCS